MLNQYSSQYKLTKFWFLILLRKIHILAKKMVPRVFHQTPRFPHPGTPGPRTPGPRTPYPVPRTPGPRDPVPRPRVFHLAILNGSCKNDSLTNRYAHSTFVNSLKTFLGLFLFEVQCSVRCFNMTTLNWECLRL